MNTPIEMLSTLEPAPLPMEISNAGSAASSAGG